MYKGRYLNRRDLRLYIASPLFNLAERTFNSNLKKLLSNYFEVYLPQEDGGLMVDMIARGMTPGSAALTVFNADIDALNRCDLILIVMDGRTIDEGATFELGFAYAKGKPCYGLQTDVRRLVQGSNNPMVDCSLCHVFRNISELIEWAQGLVREGLSDVRLFSKTQTA